MNILQQWKLYFQWLHYKVMIKKKYEKVKKDAEKLQKETILIQQEYDRFMQQKKTFLATIKHITDPAKSKNVYLVGKDITIGKNKISILWQNIKGIFQKFDGYFLRRGKGGSWKINGIKNLKNFLKLKKLKESYNLHKKEGSFKNKPMYMIAYDIPVSVNIIKEIKGRENALYYNAESYYNYEDKITKKDITGLGATATGVVDWIKNNWMVLIFVGLLLFFLFFTPEGQEILNQLLG